MSGGKYMFLKLWNNLIIQQIKCHYCMVLLVMNVICFSEIINLYKKNIVPYLTEPRYCWYGTNSRVCLEWKSYKWMWCFCLQVFHNIQDVSLALLSQFDIVLEGSPIMDIQVCCCSSISVTSELSFHRKVVGVQWLDSLQLCWKHPLQFQSIFRDSIKLHACGQLSFSHCLCLTVKWNAMYMAINFFSSDFSFRCFMTNVNFRLLTRKVFKKTIASPKPGLRNLTKKSRILGLRQRLNWRMTF